MHYVGATVKQVETVAEHIKQSYTFFKKRIFPDYEPSPKSAKDWQFAAVAVIEHMAHPDDWVSAQFAGYRLPYSAQLIGDDAAERWKEYMRTAGPRVSEELHRQVERYANFIALGRTVTEALLEYRRLGLDSGFVWCLAVINRIHDIESAHYADAVALFRRPIYREIYGMVFPEAFRLAPIKDSSVQTIYDENMDKKVAQSNSLSSSSIWDATAENVIEGSDIGCNDGNNDVQPTDEYL